MGKHIRDTHTIRWQFCVHPQFGRTLFIDTLRQAAAGRPEAAAATVMPTNVDR